MIVIFIIYENSADAKTTWYGTSENLFFNFQFSVFKFKLSIVNMT